MNPIRDARAARTVTAVAVACLSALTLAGCASTKIGAEWSDPQFAGKKLTGARIYVSCQALELAVQLVCVDQLSAQLKALGAVPLSSPPRATHGSLPDSPTVGVEMKAARNAGAVALLGVSIAPESTAVSTGPTFSFGLGGFSGGAHSGGGVGVGVGVPVGGTGSLSTGYAASANLTDLGSGKPIWTARASAPPSDNVNEQLGTLASTLLGSAQKAGLF